MDQATSPNMATHLLFIWHLFGQQSTLQLVLFKLNTLHKYRAIRALMRVGRWGGEERETEMQCKNALSLSLPDKRAFLFNSCSPPRHNDARMMSHCTLKVLLNTLRFHFSHSYLGVKRNFNFHQKQRWVLGNIFVMDLNMAELCKQSWDY